MCAICGLADASHDALLLRAVLLASASGSLLAPHWLKRPIASALKRLHRRSPSQAVAVERAAAVQRIPVANPQDPGRD